MKSVRSTAELQRLALVAGAEATVGGQRFNARAAPGAAPRPAAPASAAPAPAEAAAPEMRALREAIVALTARIDDHGRHLDDNSRRIDALTKALAVTPVRP